VDISEKSVAHIEKWLEEGFKELGEQYLISHCEWLEVDKGIRPIIYTDADFANKVDLPPNLIFLLPPLIYK